jgi:Uma2 family endonuclease
VTRLTRFLSGFVEDHQLGEVYVSPFDVVFSPFDVVEPDLVYFSNARESVLTEMNAQGAPDLVVEVLSETTEKTDRTFKLKLYGKFGVQEYWIIDPTGPAAEIYRRGEEGLTLVAKLSGADELSSPLFPGFNLPLCKLAE